MMYKIKITLSDYCIWKAYHTWSNTRNISPFNEWVIVEYPELIEVEWDINGNDRIFTFETEEHYHWFLLQQ